MSDRFTILIVDDSKAIVRYFTEILDSTTYKVHYTYSKTDAERIIKSNEIHLLICDLKLPDRRDGLATIEFFKQVRPESKVLGISSDATVENAVDIMKVGADDFLPKTSTREQYLLKIESLRQKIEHLVASNTRAKQPLFGPIIGESAAIQAVLNKLKIIAENEVESVLISGESGTGKELIARTVHQMSPRNQNPFIALNCAGIAESLVDSELFGFEKGSFTGAYNTNVGKFELANSGVLFLDEISEMPFHLQGKLLRVLENREVLRIGGSETIPVDVVIVAATNQNLLEKIKQGTFREDIYYRLNMVRIDLPALRERREDIPLLVWFFLQQFNERTGKNKHMDEAALKVLQEYAFPGNIRELKNIVYNASLFSFDSLIQKKDIETYLDSTATGGSSFRSVMKPRNMDDDTILNVLNEHDGNITKAAQALGYTREGLSRKLKKIESKK